MLRSQRIVDIAKTPDGKSRFTTVGTKDAGVVSKAVQDRTGAVIKKSNSTKRGLEEKTFETATEAKVITTNTGLKFIEKADAAPVNMTTSAISSASMHQDVLSEFTETNNDSRGMLKQNTLLNRIYRDMYYHDSICGSAVDLRSVMPFSDFSLTGIRDEKSLFLFVEAVERMNLQALMPSISISYDVFGAFVASLSWDEQRNTYNGISPQNIDNIYFTPVPVFGADPLMNLQLDERTKLYLQSTDSRMDRYKKFIPDDLRQSIEEKQQTGGTKNAGGIQGVPLSPDHTIFIPRRALLQDYMGTSLFRRAIPAWLTEKALIRGMLDQVYKRQRAVSHIVVGDTDWVPTQAEMSAIAQLFLDADLDPVGAMVVTRNGVQVSDVRRGDDFYKWTDAYDQLSTIKFRSIGTSETFLTSEASYSTIEQSLSVFMEQLRNHRSTMTNEVFYQKIFPGIAKANNITAKRNRVRETASLRRNAFYDDYGNLIVEIGAARPTLIDYNPVDYAIPRVQWHKRLMPEADRDYLDLLTTLSEKGFPVPLRMMAAAGGLDVRTVMEGKEEDLRLREEFKKYMDKIKEISPPPTDGEDGEIDVASAIAESIGLNKRNPMNRKFDDEPVNYDSKGKRRLGTKKGQKLRDGKLNVLIARAAAELGAMDNKREKEQNAYEPKRSYSFKKRS